ncbi:hypothetical protein F441_13389 [Phytophthora nicotianae CJ01A1]|uniref:Uncharacterized protein n=1 Tax=Phytophthora nicotianae CJ01A1 TaxID=1317063 RepID=W2WLM5_PHYNI|nr:hypothetical protein F441_13389 [Phytophthora nicotianae CJ01A1]
MHPVLFDGYLYQGSSLMPTVTLPPPTRTAAAWTTRSCSTGSSRVASGSKTRRPCSALCPSNCVQATSWSPSSRSMCSCTRC